MGFFSTATLRWMPFNHFVSSFPRLTSTNMSDQNQRRRQRHARTITTVATTAAVAYGAYRAYDYLFNDDDEQNETASSSSTGNWMSSLMRAVEGYEESFQGQRQGRSSQVDPRTRHRLAKQRVLSCRKEVSTAFGSFWPAILEAIEAATNTSESTKKLKGLRAQPMETDSADRQNALWRMIEVETLTRLVSVTYASSLMLLSLTMQLHWIGGELFRRSNDLPPHAVTPQSTRTAQIAMTETHKYLLELGLPMLISAVRRAVDIATEDWEPTTFLTKKDLEKMLEEVDNFLERGYPPSRKHSRNWTRIFLPDAEMENHDEACIEMIEACWDLAESPAWQDAQAQCLSTTKSFLREHGWGKPFEKEENDKEQPTQVPFAKLVAPLKTSSALVFSTSKNVNPQSSPEKSAISNKLLLRLQRLPTLLELGDVSFQESRL